MSYSDPEEARARKKRYYEAHREHILAVEKQRYQRNRERIDKLGRAYLAARPHMRQSISFANGSNRNARRLGVPGKLYGRDVIKLDSSCHYCDGPATTWDHVVPLARGGPNLIENIVRCCIACNRSKARRTPEEWRAGISIPRSSELKSRTPKDWREGRVEEALARRLEA